jgi:hypothetical protein
VNAQKVLKMVPWPVYAGAAAVLVLFIIGKIKGAKGFGEAIGAGIAGLGIGVVKGVGGAAVGAAVAVGDAAKEGVDEVVQAFTGDENQTLGGFIYDSFHPAPAGPDVYYTVTFPNGARHAIHAPDVNALGQFSYVQPPYAATRWQIVLDGAGMKLAKPII